MIIKVQKEVDTLQLAEVLLENLENQLLEGVGIPFGDPFRNNIDLNQVSNEEKTKLVTEICAHMINFVGTERD